MDRLFGILDWETLILKDNSVSVDSDDVLNMWDGDNGICNDYLPSERKLLMFSVL